MCARQRLTLTCRLAPSAGVTTANPRRFGILRVVLCSELPGHKGGARLAHSQQCAHVTAAPAAAACGSAPAAPPAHRTAAAARPAPRCTAGGWWARGPPPRTWGQGGQGKSTRQMPLHRASTAAGGKCCILPAQLGTPPPSHVRGKDGDALQGHHKDALPLRLQPLEPRQRLVALRQPTMGAGWGQRVRARAQAATCASWVHCMPGLRPPSPHLHHLPKHRVLAVQVGRRPQHD